MVTAREPCTNRDGGGPSERYASGIVYALSSVQRSSPSENLPNCQRARWIILRPSPRSMVNLNSPEGGGRHCARRHMQTRARDPPTNYTPQSMLILLFSWRCTTVYAFVRSLLYSFSGFISLHCCEHGTCMFGRQCCRVGATHLARILSKSSDRDFTEFIACCLSFQTSHV